jgi:hypothetical protein
MEINIDPNVLVSIINMKLRNYYRSLDELCEDLNINQQELIAKLESIDYIYQERKNQFIAKIA